MSADRAPFFRLAAACLLLTGVAAGLYGCKGEPPPPPPPPPKKKAVEIRPGIAVYMARPGIWKIDKAGSGKPEILLEGVHWFPVLNGAGDKVAYWTDKGALMELHVMNLISGHDIKVGEWFTLGALGRNMNVRNAPCWHPGKDVDILFFADGKQIWQVNGDGTDLQTVYQFREGSCYSVTVSPDASTFAFVGVGADNQNLWVFWVDSRRSRAITDYTNRDGRVGAPAWSPKDDVIAYAFYLSEEVNIRTVSSTGAKKGELTRKGMTNSPQWDLFGKKIVVSSGTKDPLNWQIALIDAKKGTFIDPPLATAASGAFAPSIAGEW